MKWKVRVLKDGEGEKGEREEHIGFEWKKENQAATQLVSGKGHLFFC